MFTIQQTKERSNWPYEKTMRYLGISRSNYYRWRRELKSCNFVDKRGSSSSLDRILPEEEHAVIQYALDHPPEGYRRLAWMMVDEDIAYLSPSSVYRILVKHDLLYRWKRSYSVGTKPAKPTAPNQRWHTDILYLWVCSRWYFLVTVMDAYSRYIVHWKLLFSMTADEVVDVIEEALEKTPNATPEIVSDRGSQFTGKEFRQLIKRHTLKQIKTRKQHPESNGLIERYHRSFRQEAVAEHPPSNYYSACEQITNWVNYYNHDRLHSALQYLRPIDYYCGEPEKLVKERLKKLKRAKINRRKINKKQLQLAA